MKRLFLLFALLCAAAQGAWAQKALYETTAGDVGKVVCNNGHLHPAKTAVTGGCTAVGILGRVTADGYGLIIALQDAPKQTWDAINSWTSVTAYAGTTLKLLPDDNARGSLTSYTTLGETTVSNWCVAQKSDYEAIFENLGSTRGDESGKTYDANVNAYITGAGGTAIESIYWSATEVYDYYGWYFLAGYWHWRNKAYIDKVRPVLGFKIPLPYEWDAVYTQTQTTSANWTALDAGSTTGKTLGSANAVTYYYATDNLSFTNSTVGGSGLTILGTVYLYVPEGATLTCTGADASGQTGGGAGIELTLGNSLYILGGGTLVANGGNAANGGNGSKGNDAEVNTSNDEYILGGSGGNGGNGGGGAGAGIGTCGGNGGTGGSGGQRTGSYTDETTQYGVDGNAGTAGSTAGVMGTLYVYEALAPTMNVHGGSQGSNGSGGGGGRTASQHPGSNVYMAAGGGGGGAGGFGGAASNIGTGGPGG
ncbi:MAG: hypothetical protein IKO33_07050, partial [Bacteroidaceae bacterium]|nr:hypothetical protein [Bacteroidaceae bacterium]